MRGEFNFLYVYEETWDGKKQRRRRRRLKPYKHNYSCNEQGGRWDYSSQDGYKNDVPTTVNKKRHGLEFTEVDDLKARSFSRVWKMSRTARVIPFLLLQRLDLQREDQEEVNPLSCCGSSDGDDMEMNTKMLLNGISCEAKEGEMNGLSWSKRVGENQHSSMH
ncbi:hypothetical protein F2Q68_00013110 [Brassica cretica]|uniref:Uncharacterized protein n=1 Tax=Brassica cretica TaxID=69181 RepID=A0A8S9HI45_BRACR|nr:hypothetical protein F2Q68_00013110 [Brassica cretica]